MPKSVILPAVMDREVSLEVFLNSKILFSNLGTFKYLKSRFALCGFYILTSLYD